ncbi:SMP-30/gluconolactonase/LRE family protein [Saccharopolyspora mangrovi]|uniref:SMP-30/gluconolactonase/LRE family protein n=1 Tax=Saccharopolyspora mangrovi TaxID=3082379 RepID=A0ABU6AKW8_9PSEU|nr:SMP-30/gluconolactonase/LRE family protein [Saccharopolyspora sp. S2-29]MEB3372185.1 SMP-30/gluconolactonase/LRE family protein [Saccharopolyspora sp. S2-29]
MPGTRFSNFGRPRSDRWRMSRLNEPSPLRGSNGIAFGPDGRLYVAQFLAGQISAVDVTTGAVEIVVPADGPVQAPDDLAFGADGSMYVADITPQRVWRRSPDGEFTLLSEEVRVPNGITCVGNRLFVNEMRPGGRVVELMPGTGELVVLAEGLAMGNAMQQGPDGALYYPHMMTGQVWRVSPDGGDPQEVAEDVHEPVAVRFDHDGALVVLSRGVEGIVTRIDPDTGRRSIVETGVAGMDNAAFDRENRMLVSSYGSGGVTEVEALGTRTVVGRGLNGPFGVTADEAGRVYAGDHFRLADGDLVTGDLIQPVAGGASHGVAAGGGLVHITSAHGDVRSFDPATCEVRLRAKGLAEPTGIAVTGTGLLVAETGAGRVIHIDDADAVSMIAELPHPVDVALDAEGRLFASDDSLGAVVRVEDGSVVTVVEGLDQPQGVTVHEDTLYVVEVGTKRLLAVSPTTGETRTEAESLPVGLPPGIQREDPIPTLFPPARPRAFAGLTTTPDGTLLLAANGEGTVLHLTPHEQTRQHRP